MVPVAYFHMYLASPRNHKPVVGGNSLSPGLLSHLSETLFGYVPRCQVKFTNPSPLVMYPKWLWNVPLPGMSYKGLISKILDIFGHSLLSLPYFQVDSVSICSTITSDTFSFHSVRPVLRFYLENAVVRRTSKKTWFVASKCWNMHLNKSVWNSTSSKLLLLLQLNQTHASPQKMQ